MIKGKIKAYKGEHSKAVQKRLFELGYKWFYGGKKPLYLNKNAVITLEESEFISYSEEGFNTIKEDSLLTLDSLYRIKKPIEVVLNDSYTAMVSEENVKVGCSIFSHEKVEELYNAITKLK